MIQCWAHCIPFEVRRHQNGWRSDEEAERRIYGQRPELKRFITHTLLWAVYRLNMFKLYINLFKLSTLQFALHCSGVKVQIDYAYMDKATVAPLWQWHVTICRPGRLLSIQNWRLRCHPCGFPSCAFAGTVSLVQAPSSRRYRPKSVKPPNGHTPETQHPALDRHMKSYEPYLEGKHGENT